MFHTNHLSPEADFVGPCHGLARSQANPSPGRSRSETELLHGQLSNDVARHLWSLVLRVHSGHVEGWNITCSLALLALSLQVLHHPLCQALHLPNLDL